MGSIEIVIGFTGSSHEQPTDISDIALILLKVYIFIRWRGHVSDFLFNLRSLIDDGRCSSSISGRNTGCNSDYGGVDDLVIVVAGVVVVVGVGMGWR